MSSATVYFGRCEERFSEVKEVVNLVLLTSGSKGETQLLPADSDRGWGGGSSAGQGCVRNSVSSLNLRWEASPHVMGRLDVFIPQC